MRRGSSPQFSARAQIPRGTTLKMALLKGQFVEKEILVTKETPELFMGLTWLEKQERGKGKVCKRRLTGKASKQYTHFVPEPKLQC